MIPAGGLNVGSSYKVQLFGTINTNVAPNEIEFKVNFNGGSYIYN